MSKFKRSILPALKRALARFEAFGCLAYTSTWTPADLHQGVLL